MKGQKKKSGGLLFLATSILKEVATSQATLEIKDNVIYMNGKGLEQWDPILQLDGVVKVSKLSWEEENNIKPHIIDLGNKAWMVILESHSHGSTVVIMWLILGKFTNSRGEKKVFIIKG